MSPHILDRLSASQQCKVVEKNVPSHVRYSDPIPAEPDEWKECTLTYLVKLLYLSCAGWLEGMSPHISNTLSMSHLSWVVGWNVASHIEYFECIPAVPGG